MKIIFSHLTGNANVKAAVTGFIEATLLAEFNVTIAAFPGTLLYKLGELQLFSKIRRREFDPVIKPFVKVWPWLEAGRLIGSNTALLPLINSRKSPFYIKTVAQNFDKYIAARLKTISSPCIKGVYGFEETSLHTFQQAKHLGLKCFYDLPIGYWRAAQRFQEKERERWPEWVSTMNAFNNSPSQLLQKDREIGLADHMFVASSFTANTLKEFPGILPTVEIIPYGFPPVYTGPRNYSNLQKNESLKLLFVGSLTQRKGIADVFAAIKPFRKYVQLTIVGAKTTNNCKALDNELSIHNWIPSLSREAILQLMRVHDVLVFPSLFEGFGLVITEAMSQGMPVITTDRTAGPDLIVNGKNGWLIEAGSTATLQAAIENLLYQSKSIEQAGHEAMETAHLRPWKKYGMELAEAVARII